MNITEDTLQTNTNKEEVIVEDGSELTHRGERDIPVRSEDVNMDHR